MDMDQAARQLLAALAEGTEVPGGLAFREALKRTALDGSPASLERVDALLARLRATLNPTRGVWARSSAAGNFQRLLAFYLGEAIARETGAGIAWLSHAEAVRRLPPEMCPPAMSWSQVLGIVGGILCVPLGVVEDALFGAEAPVGCRAYVDRMAVRVVEAHPDEDQRARDYLQAFATGGSLPGGLAFAEALAHCRLDGTPESLGRIDQLLLQLRSQQPAYEAFVQQPATRNFLRGVGYYAGLAVARGTGLPLRWVNPAELKAQFPDLQPRFEAAFGCVLGDRLHFPLGIVTELLFAPAPQRTLAGFAAQVGQAAAQPRAA